MNIKESINLSRRQVLIGTGSLALASLFAPKAIVLAMAEAGMIYAPNTGKWMGTTCNGCTSFCAKQVYIQDGRALNIRGNEFSKVHGKSSCPRQYLALQELYDPDRVRTPMLRTNPEKGRGIDPQFKPISWDEAISLIADQFMALREQNGTHRYVADKKLYSSNGLSQCDHPQRTLC